MTVDATALRLLFLRCSGEVFEAAFNLVRSNDRAREIVFWTFKQISSREGAGPPNLPCSDLIEMACRKSLEDKQLMGDLVRYGDRLLSGCPGAFTGEDAVQEAHIKALQYRGTFSRSWLFRVVRNKAIDICRTNQPEQFEEQTGTGATLSGDPPESALASYDRFFGDFMSGRMVDVLRTCFESGHSPESLLDCVEMTIKAMPEETRAAFRARLQGRTNDQTAADFGKSSSVVEKQVTSAFKRLLDSCGSQIALSSQDSRRRRAPLHPQAQSEDSPAEPV